MQQVKSFFQILLFSFVALLSTWQVSALAVEADSPAVGVVVAIVNINTASTEELSEALNGVGDKRAQAIVAYRESHGPFTSQEQLLGVKGIGEKVLEKNRDRIVLE